MSKHMPGPWTEYAGSVSSESATELRGKVSIRAPVAQVTNAIGREAENRANARLIAAAPELLEALKKAVKEYEGLPHSLGYEFTHLPEMRAEIAKAEGR